MTATSFDSSEAPRAYAAPAAGPSPQVDPAAEIAATLGLGGGAKWRRRAFALVILGGLAAGGWFLYQHLNTPPPPPTYRTATAATGDIVLSVGSTGTVQPVRTVAVGAEISGRILTVEADWNDKVTKGQILATMDPEPIEAQVAQARAQLEASAASVNQAYATWVEAKQADARAKALGGQGLAAKSATETAAAARARAFASLENARAQKKLSDARVDQAETDLEKAVIRSPIDGVILKRQVEPGNAVAASLQTPLLFEVVEDLSKMRLILAVDEADVAQVADGMPATFTVDAFPEKSFEAVVEQVRLAPTIDQNVVTYQVVLAVDNASGLLRPGLTATATIISKKVEDVLRVPNTALRFVPPAVAEQQRAAAEGGGRDRSSFPIGGAGVRTPGPRGPSADEKRARMQATEGGAAAPAGEARTARRGRGGRGSRVWVLRAGEPTAVRVQTGATDGSWTEITGGELKAGDEVLVGVEEVTE